MKKNRFVIFIGCCFLVACDNSKKTTTSIPDISKLTGTWKLNYISGAKIAFDGLYPNKKPTITFDVANKRINGYTGCNNFTGPLKADGNKISFTDPMAMTKMLCPGEGENVITETLKKVNSWSVSDGKTLNLIMGDIAVMRFSKK
jgi:heat shock protein HslJ